jgi:hypothetical protein
MLASLPDHFFETFDFGTGELFALQKIVDELFGRVVKEAVEELAEGTLAGFLAGHGGGIDEGAPVFLVLEVAFVFEDAEGGEDGVVGERGIVGEGFEDVADGGGTARPEDIHEAHFRFGEDWGFFSRHR